jgi:hypothetical protein
VGGAVRNEESHGALRSPEVAVEHQTDNFLCECRVAARRKGR